MSIRTSLHVAAFFLGIGVFAGLASGQSTADLQVTKTDDESPAIKAGDNFVYDIEVRNIGSASATVVFMNDTLPAGVHFVSVTTTDGTCAFASGTVTCNIGTLGTSGSAEVADITLTVKAPAAGSYVNTASATTRTTESSTTNNADSETTTIVARSTNLGITKSDAPDPVFTGDLLTYTLMVTNAGPDVARFVNVTDTLPAGVTFVASTTTDGSCSHSAGIVTCVLGAFTTSGSGSTATITITVRPSTPGSKVNNAAVTTSETDAVSSNNAASATTTVVTRSTDLDVTKTDSDDPVEVGDLFDYTIVVRNGGPQLARGVNVTDTLPANVAYVSSSTTKAGATCGHASGVVTCNLLTMNLGASVTITITVRATAAGTASDTATAVTSESDPDPSDDSDTENTTILPAPADLGVVKTAAPSSVLENDVVAFFVNVTNAGPGAALGVTLVDTVPSAFDFVSATPGQGTCGESANVVTCALGDIPNGTTVLVDIRATAKQVGVWENVAAANATNRDPDATDDADTASVTVDVQPADLGVTKEESQDPAWLDFPFFYYVNVTNSGPGDAQNVTLVDVLPLFASFDNATTSQGTCGELLGILTCDLGTLDPGENASVVVQMTPFALTQLSNTAGVDADEPDPSADDDTATETTDVVRAPADVSVTKEDDVDPVVIGDAFVYTVNVTNAGPGNATVTLVDELPPEVLLLDGAIDGDGESVGCDVPSPSVVVCEVAGLPSGGTFTLMLLVEALTNGTAVNHAEVSSTFQSDPDPSDNEVNETTTIQRRPADLFVTKSDAPDPVIVNETVTYFVNVTNNGPGNASEVVLTDAISGGFEILSNSTSQGACEVTLSNVIVCDLGDLALNATAELVFRVKPTSVGELVNIATVAGNETDPDPENNTATETTTVVGPPPPEADLEMSKSDAPDPAFVNQQVTYTLYVLNDGPDAAEDVVVSDTLPAGATFVDASGASCELVSTVLVCDVGDLDDGDSATILVNVTFAAPGTHQDFASATATTGDPDPDDNTAAENTTIEEPPVLTTADLILTKTDAPDPVEVGAPLVYTLMVRNLGPDGAENVTVVDELPAGVVVDDADGCDLDGTTLTCELAFLAAGDRHTWNVTVHADEVGNLTNVATATSDAVDPTPENATDTETTRVVPVGEGGPDAPQDLECAGEGDRIRLSWDAVTGADGYRVWRDSGEGFEEIATTSDTQYEDADVSQGPLYAYRVTALDGDLEGAPSATCRTTAIPLFPTMLVGAIALVGGVAAYVALKRRK